MAKPPINTPKGGISFRKIHTQRGPNVVSVNINKPIVTDRVVLEPIVIQIKPKANWGTPKKNPIKISLFEKLKEWDIIAP